MRILSILAMTFVAATTAQAYQGETRIGLYKESVLDTNKVTHIIIIGSAVKEDSNQFFQSGIARAEKYKQHNPEEQVVIMSSPEVRGTDDDKVFADFNIPVVEVIKSSFTAEVLLPQLKKYTQIASLDFYGHSSPWAIKLGKSNAALTPDVYEKKIRALKGNFLRSAYITINSCSSGYSIAPDLSKYLEIPVSGSLTSSLFERVESDAHFYKEEDWSQSNYVEINSVSFNEDMSCALGFCYRMKPSQFSYSSYWGQFKEGGLNFYKFFCNYENNNDGRCEAAMAKSLLNFPSIKNITEASTVEDYKAVVFDYICATYKNKTKFTECVNGINAAIAKGDNIYQTMPGPELNCDFNSCHATVTCKEKGLFGNGPKGGTCHLIVNIQPNPTNAANEFQSYVKGFKALQKR
ncbi:MAG: hypothetical protein H7336_11535 [Bacteriovorax sp.]|nr:hypothetical protein [Bacteriovorax sp.]